MKSCCEIMKNNSVISWWYREDVYWNSDNLIVYISKYDEYWIIIHDGWSSRIKIAYCPWCWIKFPESKHDMRLKYLNEVWVDPSSEIPKENSFEIWEESIK